MSVKREIVARLNQSPVFDSFVYTAKHGPARGLRRQGGMGWLPSVIPRAHEWAAEETFLEGLDWRGLNVYDVGGDQGLFTLFFADRVGHSGQVVVFEPNPRSCDRIQRNIDLNNFRNVRLMTYGLGAEYALLPFTFPAFEPARGSASPDIAEQIGREPRAVTFAIEVQALDEARSENRLPTPHFIKLDVEGMEYAALQGMSRTLNKYKPRMSIELHGATMDEKSLNVQRVVGLLEPLGYRMRHIESGERITRRNAERAKEGHLYCEA
ncbi:MAG: FkbM family methyltransferase [Gemmatimonadaceae bacterium]